MSQKKKKKPTKTETTNQTEKQVPLVSLEPASWGIFSGKPTGYPCPKALDRECYCE